MRNLKTFILILLLGSGCAGPHATEKTSKTYDPGPDIERFLGTSDPSEETKILKQLKDAKVSHDTAAMLARE